jgi:hypothetical protein
VYNLYKFLLLLALTSPSLASGAEWLDYRGIAELQLFDNNSSTNWYRGGFAKLRYDDEAVPIQLGKAALHADLRLTDTLWARTLTTAYTYPTFDPNIIEAYLNLRPVPRGPMQIRAKAGAFHLPLSTENKGLGWSSLYSTTPSVINAWVGEELRVIGGELELAWPGKARASAHDFQLLAGVYGFNDGAATIIAYRGWAPHDRQTGLGDKLRLIPEFPGQVRQFNPFREIDDRPGYYAGAGWTYAHWLEVNVLHYDNRAEPTAIRKRQIAWQTRFDHVSVELNLPEAFRLSGQYLIGDSFIDNKVTGFSSDVDYAAWFVMLSRLIGQHRLAARFERFEVDDLDRFKESVHNSDETGYSWMLSWRYQLTRELQVGTEWLQIHSERGARAAISGIRAETEKQLLFNIGYRF